MISERLFGGDGNEDRDIEQLIDEMDEKYKDIVELLNKKPDPGIYLALTNEGLHFWYNTDDLSAMIDMFAGLAAAVRVRISDVDGPIAADATIARVMADTIAEAD